MLWKPTFKFSRGPMKNQVTSERMNHILDGVKMAQPSASGHVGMTINQTPDGWVAKLTKNKSSDFSQWKILQTTGLGISIGGGKVWNWDATNVRPILDTVDGGNTLTLTASDTNYIYLQCISTPNAIESYYVAWVNSAYSMVSDVTEKANTADFTDAVSGAGFTYVKIAEVDTDGSEVTEIRQLVNETIDHKLPWLFDLSTFACPP
jgi:hypothetical protein